MLAGVACQLGLENLALAVLDMDLASLLHETADSHLPYARKELPGWSYTPVGCRGCWTRRDCSFTRNGFSAGDRDVKHLDI